MKKTLQLVCVLMAALLAAQPAFAALDCGMSVASMPCAPGCPMAMSQMGMDCPMLAQMAGVGCDGNCCSPGRPVATLQQAATRSKERPTIVAAALPVPLSLQAHELSLSSSPPGLLDANGPPRHVLLRVFRI